VTDEELLGLLMREPEEGVRALVKAGLRPERRTCAGRLAAAAAGVLFYILFTPPAA